MISPENRLRLSWLYEHLISDAEFASDALRLLSSECPSDTFTPATAGEALINHWLIGRDLNCYERGREIDAADGVVYLDENGDPSRGIQAIEESRYIDKDEFLAVCKTWRIAPPFCLSGKCESEINCGNLERPLQQQRFQEQEILRVIQELGYNPLAIPKWTPGKSGVKAEVREKLPFSEKVFDLAWERLRFDDRIKDFPSN